MRKFWSLLFRFVPNYRHSVAGVIGFSLLSTFFSLFSFAMIVPILEILFGTADKVDTLISYEASGSVFDDLKNLLYYHVSQFINAHGQEVTLIWLSVLFIAITFFKVITGYLSSIFMANMQTGVVRDMRNSILDKVLTLPLAFFSDEKKGDIMSLITVDVADVEASIMGSLDMLVKNPLMIIIYLVVLVSVSWELSLFVLIMLPFAGMLMGIVNQEAILFNDSFYNNIAFGVEHSTLDDVISAAKIANAHEFITATENGYENNVGDRGCKLSGGQRQRISIARAILKNPPILILDEATSALDTESEKLVQEALESLMKNRTTIVIAHRLSTIRNTDEICVLEGGRIIERGTHDELMAHGGAYFKLQEAQKLN